MAQLLRRPLHLASHTPSIFSSYIVTAPLQRRCFSRVAPRFAMSQQAQTLRPAQPPERSIRLASRDMKQMPSDIGMLEGTFITPPWSQQPSLFRNPRGLFKFQWKRLRTRIQDNVSNLVLKFSSPKVESWYKRAIKLNRGKLAATATTLHSTMYTAFAHGESQALRKICTDGLYDSFQARISSRSKGETTKWELVKYNKRAKLMSNRGAILPSSFGVGEGTAFRQAVVRIASKQKLTRFKQDGSVVPGTGKEKDVVEYIVIQQQISQWKQGSWKVWGTTEPTRFRSVEEM